MSDSKIDEGVLEALVERLEKQRLPRILDLLKQVNAKKSLNEFELTYLKEVIDDSQNVIALIARHPEYQLMEMRLIATYKEILEKALETEQSIERK